MSAIAGTTMIIFLLSCLVHITGVVATAPCCLFMLALNAGVCLIKVA